MNLIWYVFIESEGHMMRYKYFKRSRYTFQLYPKSDKEILGRKFASHENNFLKGQTLTKSYYFAEVMRVIS